MPGIDTFDLATVLYAIDDQVARLGWSKEQRVAFVMRRYKVRSRLFLTNEQLVELLETLTSLNSEDIKQKRKSRRKRRMRD